MKEKKLNKMIEEIEAVSRLPKPWEDCTCEEVAGDNKYCVIHKLPHTSE